MNKQKRKNESNVVREEGMDLKLRFLRENLQEPQNGAIGMRLLS